MGGDISTGSPQMGDQAATLPRAETTTFARPYLRFLLCEELYCIPRLPHSGAGLHDGVLASRRHVTYRCGPLCSSHAALQACDPLPGGGPEDQRRAEPQREGVYNPESPLDKGDPGEECHHWTVE